MIFFSHSFCEVVLHILLVSMAFYCSQRLHGCIGMLRLLGQYLIVITSSRWVLPVAIVCSIGSLENCHLPPPPINALKWFLKVCIALLTKFLQWFHGRTNCIVHFSCLVFMLLRLSCQGCVLLVKMCPMPSALSITSQDAILDLTEKILSTVLIFYNSVQYLCNSVQLLLI